MQKFRMKRAPIEAVQWTGKNFEEITNWCGATYEKEELKLITTEGVVIVSVGYWITKNDKNEFYLIDQNIFKAIYEIDSCCQGGPQWGHAWNCPTLPG